MESFHFLPSTSTPVKMTQRMKILTQINLSVVISKSMPIGHLKPQLKFEVAIAGLF